MTNEISTSIDSDRELIAALGGPAQVARLLGLKKDGCTQRVHNWTVRGIPSAIKLAYPEIFLSKKKIKLAGVSAGSQLASGLQTLGTES